jgi:hypothetical protein
VVALVADSNPSSASSSAEEAVANAHPSKQPKAQAAATAATGAPPFAAKKASTAAAAAQSQQQWLLQQFVKGVMTLELLLHPSGVVAGGSITLAAPFTAATAAAGGVGRVPAHPAAVLSSQKLRVMGGFWAPAAAAGCLTTSSSSSSVIFLTRAKGGSSTAAAAAKPANSPSSSGGGGSTWFAFAGQYQDGQLLGQWVCLDATAAAAAAAAAAAGATANISECSADGVAAWQLVLGAFSNAPGSVSAAARAAGSFDWLMHHDAPDWLMHHDAPEPSQVGGSSVGV